MLGDNTHWGRYGRIVPGWRNKLHASDYHGQQCYIPKRLGVFCMGCDHSCGCYEANGKYDHDGNLQRHGGIGRQNHIFMHRILMTSIPRRGQQCE